MDKGIPNPDLGQWNDHLDNIITSPKSCDLANFLLWRQESGARIYPQGKDVFNALNLTSPEDVKVVILGQDPYHGPGQAHGLAFSVQDGCPIPPSLRNMYQELSSDLGVEAPKSGNLTGWAKQGVLLLNAILTVEESEPLSHKNKGWEEITDKVIKTVSDSEQPCVFILWGSHAQKKEALIDQTKNLIIKNVHPSPLSAHRGFFGSKPFSAANTWLKSKGRSEIDWKL